MPRPKNLPVSTLEKRGKIVPQSMSRTVQVPMYFDSGTTLGQTRLPTSKMAWIYYE